MGSRGVAGANGKGGNEYERRYFREDFAAVRTHPGHRYFNANGSRGELDPPSETELRKRPSVRYVENEEEAK